MDFERALSLVMALCLRFEGVYLKPYLCPAGVPTIGCGSTQYLDGRAVKLTDPAITYEHAMVLLKVRVLGEFMPAVLRLCRVRNERELAAITDYAYNLGINALKNSTLRRRINEGRWDLVPDELRKWVYAAGKKLRGLVTRREAEIQML